MTAQGKPGFLAEMDKIGNELAAWLAAVPDMIMNLGPTNYTLGLRFYAENKFADAAFRFKVALWFKPDLYQAWYHLGNCLRLQKKNTDAIRAYYKALHFKPDYEEARFMLALSDPKTPEQYAPHTYPVPLVILNFTALADDYEQIELKQRNYVSHTSLFHALQPYLTKPVAEALDMGCGTGLLGDLLRPHVKNFTAVDMAPAMADRALTRYTADLARVYDTVITEDLRAYLLRFSRPMFDLLVAANVMGYVGGLAAVFDGATKALNPGGIFAFTTDAVVGDGYGFIRGKDRFGHSEAYIRGQTARVGLNVISASLCPLAENETGMVWVLQKPAHA